MSSDFNINEGRYWQEGVQLVSGCTPCSPGCDYCWSAAMAHRFDIEGEPGHENHIITKNDAPVFNGVVICHPDRLKRFNTHKPKVFAIWNDLYHEDVPDDFRIQTYRGMSANPQNTYLILTKRPQQMLSFCQTLNYYNIEITIKPINHPLNHVWHGLTVCNQQEADEKIPIFLQVPGKKFLSIEPMLSDINIVPYIGMFAHRCDCGWHDTEYDLHYAGGRFYCPECEIFTTDYAAISSVILGGETGHGARPLHPDWVRSVRDQCAAAGVAFFFKSWGKHVPVHQKWSVLNKGRMLDKRTHDDLPWVKQ